MIQLKNQIHFCDIYEEVEDCFKEDKPKFIKLFEEYINVKVLIPQTFFNAYYSSTGHPRDSKEWSDLYKIRPVTERTNNIVKNPLGLSTLKINKTDSLKSELFIAGITQLIALLISYKVNNKNNIFSIKSLVC